MEKQLESLGKRWASICRWTEKQWILLQEVLLKWQHFKDEQDMFADWLAQKEQLLGQMRLADVSDPAQVVAQVKHLKVWIFFCFLRWYFVDFLHDWYAVGLQFLSVNYWTFFSNVSNTDISVDKNVLIILISVYWEGYGGASSAIWRAEWMWAADCAVCWQSVCNRQNILPTRRVPGEVGTPCSADGIPEQRGHYLHILLMLYEAVLSLLFT